METTGNECTGHRRPRPAWLEFISPSYKTTSTEHSRQGGLRTERVESTLLSKDSTSAAHIGEKRPRPQWFEFVTPSHENTSTKHTQLRNTDIGTKAIVSTCSLCRYNLGQLHETWSSLKCFFKIPCGHTLCAWCIEERQRQSLKLRVFPLVPLRFTNGGRGALLGQHLDAFYKVRGSAFLDPQSAFAAMIAESIFENKSDLLFGEYWGTLITSMCDLIRSATFVILLENAVVLDLRHHTSSPIAQTESQITSTHLDGCPLDQKPSQFSMWMSTPLVAKSETERSGDDTYTRGAATTTDIEIREPYNEQPEFR